MNELVQADLDLNGRISDLTSKQDVTSQKIDAILEEQRAIKAKLDVIIAHLSLSTSAPYVSSEDGGLHDSAYGSKPSTPERTSAPSDFGVPSNLPVLQAHESDFQEGGFRSSYSLASPSASSTSEPHPPDVFDGIQFKNLQSFTREHFSSIIKPLNEDALALGQYDENPWLIEGFHTPAAKELEKSISERPGISEEAYKQECRDILALLKGFTSGHHWVQFVRNRWPKLHLNEDEQDAQEAPQSNHQTIQEAETMPVIQEQEAQQQVVLWQATQQVSVPWDLREDAREQISSAFLFLGEQASKTIDIHAIIGGLLDVNDLEKASYIVEEHLFQVALASSNIISEAYHDNINATLRMLEVCIDNAGLTKEWLTVLYRFLTSKGSQDCQAQGSPQAAELSGSSHDKELKERKCNTEEDISVDQEMNDMDSNISQTAAPLVIPSEPMASNNGSLSNDSMLDTVRGIRAPSHLSSINSPSDEDMLDMTNQPQSTHAMAPAASFSPGTSATQLIKADPKGASAFESTGFASFSNNTSASPFASLNRVGTSSSPAFVAATTGTTSFSNTSVTSPFGQLKPSSTITTGGFASYGKKPAASTFADVKLSSTNAWTSGTSSMSGFTSSSKSAPAASATKSTTTANSGPSSGSSSASSDVADQCHRYYGKQLKKAITNKVLQAKQDGSQEAFVQDDNFPEDAADELYYHHFDEKNLDRYIKDMEAHLSVLTRSLSTDGFIKYMKQHVPNAAGADADDDDD